MGGVLLRVGLQKNAPLIFIARKRLSDPLPLVLPKNQIDTTTWVCVGALSAPPCSTLPITFPEDEGEEVHGLPYVRTPADRSVFFQEKLSMT